MAWGSLLRRKAISDIMFRRFNLGHVEARTCTHAQRFIFGLPQFTPHREAHQMAARKYFMESPDWRYKLDIFVKSRLAITQLHIKFFLTNVTDTQRLLLKLFRGETLSRKERQLLSRTTAELFRLVPFAAYILVPLIEFMLPLVLKFLPSPFLQNIKQQEASRRKLNARIEYANFLHDTAREMAQVVHNLHSGGITQTAEKFDEFTSSFRMGLYVSNKKILCFAKLFNDEITLDNISRPHLMDMCKCMGITPYGTTNFVRFILRERLKSIRKGDELIQVEGVESLSEAELRKYCRERGIHAGEEMRQQLCDWLDLSLKHSIPSSLLILSRDYIKTGIKPEQLLLDTMMSLPFDLLHNIGATSLPSKNRILYKRRKLQSVDLQKKQIKEEEKELSVMKKSDFHSTQDVAFNEMTIPTANGGTGQAAATAANKQAQLCELSNTNAILASALSLKLECDNFWRLVNEEICRCNSIQDKVGADVEKETMKAHIHAPVKNFLDTEVNVNIKVSSLLKNRADALIQKIGDVDAKSGEYWQVLDRYSDGKVGLEAVAAATLFLKNTLDKEGLQDLVYNHSKYKDRKTKREMAARKTITLLGARGLASYGPSGYTRSTVGLSTPVIQRNPTPDFGMDDHHWLISVKQPHGTREQIAAEYVRTLTEVVGDEQAARKMIYSVSTRCYYAFGALIDQDIAKKLQKLPNVERVIPDAYIDFETKNYGGEPFVDGQLVPYDPKYHQMFDELRARSKARNQALDLAAAEIGVVDDDDDDDDSDTYHQ